MQQEVLDVGERMHADQLLDAGARRLVMQQHVVQAARVEFIHDRVESRRALRMMVTHAMQVTMGMSHESDCHGRLRLR